jgi:hypothetical protein
MSKKKELLYCPQHVGPLFPHEDVAVAPAENSELTTAGGVPLVAGIKKRQAAGEHDSRSSIVYSCMIKTILQDIRTFVPDTPIFESGKCNRCGYSVETRMGPPIES